MPSALEDFIAQQAQSISLMSDEAQDALMRDLEILVRYGTRAEVDERCRNDPWLFALTFFEHMMREGKTGELLPRARFHEELYDICRRAILGLDEFDYRNPLRKKGTAIAAPRGFAKSTVVSLIVVIWAIVYEHKKFVVILSDTGDQAEALGTNIRREFEDNEVLRFYFGDMTGFRFGLKWTLKNFQVCKTDERGRRTFVGRILVSGSGTALRGMRDRQNRPDLVVGDDLENDDHVENEIIREWMHGTWWGKAIFPMVDPTYGTFIVVGTILHFDSLLSRLLLEETTYWTKLWTCYDENGDSMWPERFPLEWLRAYQEDKPIAFAQEFLNDPNPADTRAFRAEAVNFYTFKEIDRAENGTFYFRGYPLDIYVGVDPAISEEETASEFAAIVVGVTRDRWNVIVIQAIMTRMDFPAQLERVVKVAEFYNANTVGIEDQAYQKALESMTRRKIRDSISVKPLKHGGSTEKNKKRRIMALAPLVAAGRLWMRRADDNEPGHMDQLNRLTVHEDQWRLYLQLMQFPKGTLMDGADALASAIETAGHLPIFAPGTFTDPRRLDLHGLRNKIGLADFYQSQKEQILRAPAA